MKRISRRGFLRTGITGAAGIMALSPSLVSASSSEQEKNIIYRTLGKTGIKVPIVSMGVMNSDNPNLCKAAYENGMTLFDTANGYQNGRNEEMLGNLFKDYPRKSFVLATKVKPSGPDEFLEKFNISLKRLGMDYVDILYMHGVDNPEIFDNKPLVNIMKKLKKDGKTRFIGFSTHKNMAAMISAAAATDNWDVILTSYNYKVANIDEMNSSLKKANEAGLGIVAMKTIPGGGYFDREKTKPMNTSAAIKWVLSNPDVHTAIPGMTNFDQLDLNVKVMADITLTEQDKKDILIAYAEPGLYCSGCNKCIPACPFNLPVPELMRAYMYAYGYSNMAMAHSLLGDLGTGSDPCQDCDTCKVKCTRNFKVKEKITDISRLVNVPTDFLI
jgi:predicted aldo/keto reductase-like oxidoreductase